MKVFSIAILIVPLMLSFLTATYSEAVDNIDAEGIVISILILHTQIVSEIIFFIDNVYIEPLSSKQGHIPRDVPWSHHL